MKALVPVLLLSLLAPLAAQEERPVFRVDVVARTARAINYRHRSGSTKIDFRGTMLLPRARGEAKVESKQGYIEIEVEFKDLDPATKFGAEYLTYVMWAITPEGRAANLGELLLNGSRSKLNVTTELQAFGMVVTAEPYFSVTRPSDLLVMENEVRSDTKGRIEEIDAKFELLKRGQYEKLANPLSLTLDPKVPLELYEARNAVQIAHASGAGRFARDTLERAARSLEQAEAYLARNSGMKPVTMLAREAVQTAEDARAIAVRRAEEERLERERVEAEARTEAARAKAEEEVRLRVQAETARKLETERRLKAEKEKAEAERLRLEAELAAARLAAQKAEADAAKARALLQEQLARTEAERLRREAEEADRLRREAEEAERLRRETEAEKLARRARLLDQLSLVLDTTDSQIGLVVCMPEVFFEDGASALKPAAREKLARVSGLLLSHRGLSVSVEGHTGNTSGESSDLGLATRRAEAVRDYLIGQGLAPFSVSARGVDEVAPADGAGGANNGRRVELIVSGELIGGK